MSEFEDKLQSILGDPDAMGQIMSLAQSISGAPRQADAPPGSAQACDSPPEEGPDLFSLLDRVDPRLLQLGMRLAAEYHIDDEPKRNLLAALRPFLREERYAKADKAIRAAKLAHVIRVALDSFRKGDADLV